MRPGDKVYFSCDPAQQIFTIKAISPYVEMAELDEIPGGWCWIENLVRAEAAPEPDPMDSQLQFLGL